MKTVQIDCVLEFNFEGNLTKGELVAKAIEALENASDEEIGKMLQIEEDINEWHYFDDDGEEMDMEMED